MRAPVVVTGPTEQVVSLADLKAHLRVDHSAEDALITSLEAAAVAHLDGWSGALGRGIMPQTWAQEFDGWGTYKLAFADVDNVTAVGILDGVETAATDLEVTATASGVCVEVDGAQADTVRITYQTAMPAGSLPAIQMAVKLMVAHWFEHREAVSEMSLKEAPMAVNALLSPLRAWVV